MMFDTDDYQRIRAEAFREAAALTRHCTAEDPKAAHHSGITDMEHATLEQAAVRLEVVAQFVESTMAELAEFDQMPNKEDLR